jgi:hypothetical protein
MLLGSAFVACGPDVPTLNICVYESATCSDASFDVVGDTVINYASTCPPADSEFEPGCIDIGESGNCPSLGDETTFLDGTTYHTSRRGVHVIKDSDCASWEASGSHVGSTKPSTPKDEVAPGGSSGGTSTGGGGIGGGTAGGGGGPAPTTSSGGSSGGGTGGGSGGGTGGGSAGGGSAGAGSGPAPTTSSGGSAGGGSAGSGSGPAPTTSSGGQAAPGATSSTTAECKTDCAATSELEATCWADEIACSTITACGDEVRACAKPEQLYDCQQDVCYECPAEPKDNPCTECARVKCCATIALCAADEECMACDADKCPTGTNAQYDDSNSCLSKFCATECGG